MGKESSPGLPEEMEIDEKGEEKAESKDEIEKKDVEMKEPDEAPPKPAKAAKKKSRRRGKKRKRDARVELTNDHIRHNLATQDQLVRMTDQSCFVQPPPTKKNMRHFRNTLPDLLSSSRVS